MHRHDVRRFGNCVRRHAIWEEALGQRAAAWAVALVERGVESHLRAMILGHGARANDLHRATIDVQCQHHGPVRELGRRTSIDVGVLVTTDAVRRRRRHRRRGTIVWDEHIEPHL